VTGPTLRGEHVVLRPVRPTDRDRLGDILAEPSVARWWGPGRPDLDVTDEWLDIDPGSTTWVIEVEGAVAGCIQASEEADPDYRHAGLDLFLATAYQDRGFGTDAIRTVARHLFDAGGHRRLTIDPAAANERAIRAYGRVGFRPIGIMRAYERGPDGSFHDGLLMDLLRDELI
jgi:aminoglycoside 6'-N-acetyltransferase